MPNRVGERRVPLIVAIDGPAGAGKSTVAKRLARELGYTYLDTGAMYRAIAWKVNQESLDPADEAGLRRILAAIRLELIEEEGGLRLILDGRDVTHEIRTPEMSQMASKVSEFKVVRDRMVEIQRAMGARGKMVAEGRDVGTVVFPHADVKIYLDASKWERARRRFRELEAQGLAGTLEETLFELEERDRRDQERAVAPLRKAEDAVVIDSTSYGVDTVVDQIMQEVKNKKSPNPVRRGE